MIATPLSAEETTTSANAKLVALTFDDGPGPYTEELLNALNKRNVKVTFFLVGSCVKNRPAIVKREYAEGHQLATHSWNHAKLTNLGKTDIINEINKTENAIDTACGTDVGPLMLRPPYGSSNNTVKAAANRPIILWSVDPLDWKYRNETTVKNNIVSGAKDGAIILVHDIHPTSVKGAIAAIDELQKKGYTFVTVKELFRRKGITPANGVSYSNAPANGVDLGPLDPYEYDESKLSEHWAYEYIQYVKNHGIMNGLSESKFGPEYPMTRAMFATVIARLSGETLTGYDNPFTDVPKGKWYSEAITWAAAKGIVNGVGQNKFKPDEYVTREQAAVMINNYLKYLHIGHLNYEETAFYDADKISPWAVEAVTVITNKGIMNGTNKNTFDPQNITTRAQAAVILTKTHQLKLVSVSIKDTMARIVANNKKIINTLNE